MAALEIGTKKEAVEAAKTAILEILNTRADQETIRVAINAMLACCEVKGVSVSHCNFVTGEEKELEEHED